MADDPLADSYGTLWDALRDKKPIDYGTFGDIGPIETALLRI